MNRLGFLKRLGALAVTAMVAEPIIEALIAPHSIANGDKILYYHIIHGDKEYTYWMWESEYLKIMEYEKDMGRLLYDKWIESPS